MLRLLRALLLVCALPLSFPAAAQPRIPGSDAAVLERLPIRANDPTGRELRLLRDALAVNPRDAAAATGLARRYFELASAQGDPRYIGYAEAALRPWSNMTNTTDAPVEVVLVGALLKQYRHDFTSAMADLERVLVREPGNTEAMAWQFALHLVQAQYEAARKDCDRLAPSGTALETAACRAVVDSLTGKSRAAYATLSAALAKHPAQSTAYHHWVLTRLAEMALRSGDRARAEAHFKQAIALAPNEGFALAAYADLLLDENRPQEVLSLLRAFENSDIQLLRLALAAQAAKSPDAPRYMRSLADRFAASSLRGDRLHLQEQARFELRLRGDAAAALKLARDNWSVQREPRDARLLMEAALAARDIEAARPALEWMKATGYEDPRYRALVEALGKPLQ